MIPRYEIPQISAIFSDENKFQKFLLIEKVLLTCLEDAKIIPANTHLELNNVKINLKRIEELEIITRHDVIAFCSSITEQLPDHVGRFFHFGVTSSDIIDTALSLQIKDALTLILEELDHTLKLFADLSLKYRYQLCMGRSHGIYAEPLTLGQKILGFHQELKRHTQDLKNFYQHSLTCMLSGAVGNYTLLSTSIEENAAKKLGLIPETLSTQIIPRDRIAKLVSITSLIANAIERFAIEIRHLHHSDVREVAEGFAKGQKGSSIMPHKKNPIASENISGLARYLRSHLNLAMENSLLWHERDISHSSAERLYLPDHFGILFYVLKRTQSLLQGLEFDTNTMEQKVFDYGNYLSSFYLHELILNLPHAKREDLYLILQKAAFKKPLQSPSEFTMNLQEELNQHGITYQLKEMNRDEIKKIYTKEVDAIFKRALG